MKKDLTDKQAAALDKLRQPLRPHRIHGYLMTGVNTVVLCNLRERGFITASKIHLGGVVSDDFAIVVR